MLREVSSDFDTAIVSASLFREVDTTEERSVLSYFLKKNGIMRPKRRVLVGF